MFNLFRILQIFVGLAVISATSGAFAQNSDLSKAISKSGFFDISDLRFSNPDEYIRQVYLRDSSYTYLLNPDSLGLNNDWILASRDVFIYNHQGLKTISTTSNRVEDDWKFTSKNIFTYLESNKLGLQQELEWVDSVSSWGNKSRSSFYYNYAGLENEVQVSIWLRNGWEPYFYTLKEYTSNDDLSSKIEFTWHTVSQEWIEYSQSLYLYNENDLLLSTIFQKWNDTLSVWENISKNSFAYDVNNHLVESIQSLWDEITDEFVDNSKIFLEYNDDGQVLGMRSLSINENADVSLVSQVAGYDVDGNLGNVLHSQWDEQSQEWEVVKRLSHFYSQNYIGNLDDSASAIKCVFSNPHTLGQNWFCSSLKSDIQYSYDVFDILGRHYGSGIFLGQSSFRLKDDIPDGYYTVVIRGGLDLHSEKVLIRH